MIKRFLVSAFFMLLFLNANIVYANTNDRAYAPKIIDLTPPEVISISKDKDNVKTPGTVGINVKATDNISGINSIYLQFYNEQYNSYIDAFIDEYGYDKTTDSYNVNIEIGEFTLPGTYKLSRLHVHDNANNTAIFETVSNNLNFDISFVVENDITDVTPPEIISISKDKDSVKAPGTLGIKLKATDDISGIAYIFVDFYNEEYNTYLYPPSIVAGSYVESTDSYNANIEIDEYKFPGTYKLARIEAVDNSGNSKTFDSYNNNLSFDLSFIVENDIIDVIPPEIISISKDKDTIKAPGALGINVKAKDDIFGVANIFLTFYNEEYDSYIQKFIDVYDYDETTDSYNANIEISPYELPGTYKLNMISVQDKANNYKVFDSYNNNLNFDLSFIVENDNSADLVTSTRNPNLVNDIKNTVDGSTILIDCESDSNISADVFDAIMGTNKKIRFQKGGVQWIFNGKDIKIPCSMDLNIEIQDITDYRGDNYTQINSVFKDIPAFVINLENNGTLPGKALFRLKADNAFIENIVSKNLYVYYYDTTTDKIILIERNLNETNDEFFEFEITNNSDYIVSNSDLSNNDSNNSYTDDDSSDSDTDDNNSSSVSNSKTTSNDNVFFKLYKAKSGDTITLKMNNDTKIPYSVLKTIKDKNITLILKFKNYSWTIEGENIDLNSLENSFIDITLKINDNTDENQVVNFTTLHEKDYPFTATLNINIPKQYVNEKLYLYRQTNDDYEYVSDINAYDNGNVNANINKGGNFIIVKTKLQTKDSLENSLNVNKFNDIENHWAKDSIMYLTNKKILCGTSETMFQPDENMTRAMFITALGRIADVDAIGKESIFSDTVKDSWYDGYVAYAYENNIISGIGDNNFSPNRPITREEMATIISNFFNETGIELYQTNELVEFNDSDEISSWAKDSVKTIQMAGIMKGKPNNLFDPKASATRAEASIVLENVSKIYIK